MALQLIATSSRRVTNCRGMPSEMPGVHNSQQAKLMAARQRERIAHMSGQVAVRAQRESTPVTALGHQQM